MKLESYKAIWNMIASMAFFRFSPRISRRGFNRVSRCTLDTLATPASATEYKKDLSSPWKLIIAEHNSRSDEVI
jgi:hypothetical protein